MDIKEPKTKRATKKNTRKEKYKRNGKYNNKSIRLKESNINNLSNKQVLQVNTIIN